MKSENEEAEQLLTREQVAQRWQLSVKSVDRARNKEKNHLKSTTIGSSIRFRLRDVEAYEKQHTQNFNTFDFYNLSDDEIADLDPAAYIKK